MSAREDLPTGLDAVPALARVVAEAVVDLWLPLVLLAVLLGAVLLGAFVHQLDQEQDA